MKLTRKTTRGERNNNYLNIRWNPSYNWMGQTGHDPEKFCRFSSPLYGLRAGFALMRTYNRKYGIKTIRTILERFAPPSENNTAKYINDVCRETQLCPDTPIEYNSPDMRRVIKAMCKIESDLVPEDALILTAQRMIL